MKFRTELSPKKTSLILSPEKPVVMFGSCFSENIAMKMRECLWQAVNPGGTLYNPCSISGVLKLMLLSLFPDKDFEKSLFLSDNKYHSWLFDSKLSAYSAVDSLASFRKRRTDLIENLSDGGTLIITFGTSRVYSLVERKNFIVGNCHKQPSAKFETRRLSIKEITDDWSLLLRDLKKKIPSLQVIFTVSPVRHLKDGFEENTLSKATLCLSVDELCKTFEYCHYFPAFELLNDDLRDYRFYSSDLCHPSEEAIEYVWEKFKATFLDERGISIVEKGERINKALNHRPLPDSSVLIPDEIIKEKKERKEKLLLEYNSLKKEHPGLLDIF